MINVTKSYLPSIERYLDKIKGIWENHWLTNNGPLVKELEEKIKQYLSVKHCFYCSNGTIALQLAIKALDLSGEIITTPFSYVATVNSILWENCNPVFVDINEMDFNIDVSLIESKITQNTKGILVVHVYGNPVNIEKLNMLAKKYNLKIIYDGAHAFASKYMDKALLGYGDISTCSLHATKLFHSIEGGLVITDDDDIARKLYLLRQFGHEGDNYIGIGINAKNSEFHAAMGLCVLEDIDYLLQKREEVIKLYDSLLNFTKLSKPIPLKGSLNNNSYYPVVFESEEVLKFVVKKLNEHEIYPRRYFFPSLNTLPQVVYEECRVSENISKRVLALPLSAEIEAKDIEAISAIINSIV